MLTRGMRALAPLSVLALVAGCTASADSEPAPTVTETVTASPEAEADGEFGEYQVDAELLNDPSFQEMLLNDQWVDVSDEDQELLCTYWQDKPDEALEGFHEDGLTISRDVFVDWTADTCGSPEPEASSTPSASDRTVTDDPSVTPGDLFYRMTEGDQDSFCETWRSGDEDAAAQELTGGDPLPVSEDEFKEWATFTCG